MITPERVAFQAACDAARQYAKPKALLPAMEELNILLQDLPDREKAPAVQEKKKPARSPLFVGQHARLKALPPAKTGEVKALPKTAPQAKTRMPPGVHVTGQPRIGDEQRNACLEWLGETMGSGHISQPEFDARAVAALKAQTMEELNILLRDLPEKAPAVAVQEKKKPARGPLFALAAITAGAIVLSFFSPAAAVSIFVILVVAWIAVFAANR